MNTTHGLVSIGCKIFDKLFSFVFFLILYIFSNNLILLLSEMKNDGKVNQKNIYYYDEGEESFAMACT